jgi:hypothetical protein
VDERFAEMMRDPAVVKDTRLLGDFAVIYCKGMHADATRSVLDSDAVALGVYAPRPPIVCATCAGLLRYAERRRALCPKDPKPFCSSCDTHCYRADMRESMRDMMRYAGPRSMLHGHAVDGLRHFIEGRRHKAAMRRGSGTEGRQRPT